MWAAAGRPRAVAYGMPSDDLPPAFVTVDGLDGRVARVHLPDGAVAVWSLASLPRSVREGDVVRLTVTAGDLDVEIDPARTREGQADARGARGARNATGPTGGVGL